MNAGRVELDLVAVGKDQVTAMLRQVDAQMRKTAESANIAAASTNTLGAKVDGLKASAGGVNKVREGFENLRSNAGFLIGAVTGIVGIVTGAIGAIIDFANANDTAAQAAKRWAEESKKTADAVKKAYDIIYDFNRSQEEEALANINAQLYLAEKTAKALKGDYEALQPVLRDINTLRSAQAALESKIASDLERQAAALALIARRSRDEAGKDVENNQGYPTDPFADTDEDKKRRLDEAIKKNPRRSGGGGRAQDPADRFDDIVRQQRDMADRLKIIGTSSGFGNASTSGGSESSGLTHIATDAEKAAAAFDKLAQAITPVLDEMLPGLGDAFGGVNTLIQTFTESTGKSTKALIESAATGATAMLGGIGQIMGGKRGLFTGEALGEEAAALASLAVGDVAGFAIHQGAAAAYGVAAAAMGGGKGGGGGGGARGGGGGITPRGSESGGGSVTNIFHFSTLVTDGQQVTTAVNRAARSSRGTGQAARSGV